MYSAICEALHREMERMEDKYANGGNLNSEDLVDIDRIAHALKSIATYEAMGAYPKERERYYDRREYRRY